MALPIIEGFTKTANYAPITNILTVDKPFGVIQGELLMILVNTDDKLDNLNPFPTLSGWNTAFYTGAQFYDTKTTLYWRISDGTESPSETLSMNVANGSDHYYAWYIRVSGADPSNPITLGNSYEANGTRIIASGNTSKDDSIVFITSSMDGGVPVVTMAGSGWPTAPVIDQFFDNTNSESSGSTILWVTKDMPTIAATTLVIDYSYGGITAQVLIINPINLLIEQESFRFRNDDGNEINATWKGVQDQNTIIGKNEKLRLRTLINMTGEPLTQTLELQYKRKDEPTSEWRNF